MTQVRAHTHSNETVISIFSLQSILSIQTKPDSSMESHKFSPLCIADLHILRDRWACNKPFGCDFGGGGSFGLVCLFVLFVVVVFVFPLPIVSITVTTF